ncbi:hypothetical protein PFISCL1PPCAC_10283 [Pristionchus fissidentatus]|uniref:Uncharacterized protein n=1 Tax=Pristionchus fissidentatus TaxID=1538716 RepID=A0AAV5VHW2_9BILA|nr:hypothetical protein PFISCL1PPCAC_10283 [Pristionchus fissidentatus]
MRVRRARATRAILAGTRRPETNVLQGRARHDRESDDLLRMIEATSRQLHKRQTAAKETVPPTTPMED